MGLRCQHSCDCPARLPRLTIEGAYNRYDPDLRLTAARYNGELGVFGDSILATDLVLRLPLFTGGRLVAEVRAAELLEASAGQRLARSRGDLIYNVASFYFSILAQQRLITALELSDRALASHLTQVQMVIAEHKAAAVDGLRSEVKLADIRQRLLREQNILAIQQQSLLNLLGANGSAENFSLADTLQTPPAEAENVGTLVDAALQNRADVIAVRHETDAQAARLDAARAGHWPTVNFVGAVGNRVMSSPSQQPAGLSNNDRVSRFGVTVEIPIFEGGRTTARIDEEHAKLNAQRERLEKLTQQVRLEIASARANLASALERLKSTEKSVRLATKVTDIEREKYALARGTLLDVLDAQSALLDAEATHIRALADANTANAQLRWAKGETAQ
jgi:outer membrane protein TolC